FIDLDVVVECSSGTYIRALARDLGEGLGVGGHLTALRRTRVGPFTLDHARTLDQLADEPGLSLDIDAAIRTAFPHRRIDKAEAESLRDGRWLDPIGLSGVYADRKSTRLNSSHVKISYAVFCLKKKKHKSSRAAYC